MSYNTALTITVPSTSQLLLFARSASGINIPDPGFPLRLFLLLIPCSGSWIRTASISEPGSHFLDPHRNIPDLRTRTRIPTKPKWVRNVDFGSLSVKLVYYHSNKKIAADLGFCCCSSAGSLSPASAAGCALL